MALAAAGSLSLKTTAGASRNIQLEINCNNSGNASLSGLSVAAGKTANHSMLEFYSYAHPLGAESVTDSTPSGTCSSTGQCTATTNSTTASVDDGCPDSYSWSYLSGNGGTALSPSSATSAFRLTNIVCGSGNLTSDFRCTIVRAGTSSKTVDITADWENLADIGSCL